MRPPAHPPVSGPATITYQRQRADPVHREVEAHPQGLDHHQDVGQRLPGEQAALSSVAAVTPAGVTVSSPAQHLLDAPQVTGVQPLDSSHHQDRLSRVEQRS